MFLCGSFLFPHVLFFRRCITISAKELHINDEIKAKEVRMLDENGTQLGIMDLESARKYAEDRDLDLVLIAPQAAPPVCRAMDYGKYCYEQDKREREARKKQQVVELKEVRLSCRIDKHDFDTKVALAKKFLSSGNKVRANLRFKGREITHPEIGAEMLERFAEACSEVGSVEKKPKLEGRTMSIFIAPSKGE
ncbi:MAG: translation initiation factor IF-3 [Clostridia bacterium]|nr:translation initiation factor IF-3 [Clostridia bacterium]MBR6918574.1 translation initiation factor IF-3 [Clostridia bacterium]MBR7032496.1 translation initiation factor IF-3 [Clostridia bacterium]